MDQNLYIEYTYIFLYPCLYAIPFGPFKFSIFFNTEILQKQSLCWSLMAREAINFVIMLIWTDPHGKCAFTQRLEGCKFTLSKHCCFDLEQIFPTKVASKVSALYLSSLNLFYGISLQVSQKGDFIETD